jgi:hypothetical protein
MRGQYDTPVALGLSFGGGLRAGGAVGQFFGTTPCRGEGSVKGVGEGLPLVG